MKQSLLSRFAFELLILVSLWLVTSCSREQEQPTPQITAQKLFITASNITKANQINKLLAYSLTGNRYTQYHYGSFTADGLPGKITQTVLTDAISGVSINGFLDDSSRVKTLYCSYHHVKDSLMLSFKYPNPTTVIVNIYRINWASNYIKLRHRVTLRKTGDSFDVVTTASYHRALKGPESITEAGSMSPIPVALTKGALEADELNPTGVPISSTLLAGKSNLRWSIYTGQLRAVV